MSKEDDEAIGASDPIEEMDSCDDILRMMYPEEEPGEERGSLNNEYD